MKKLGRILILLLVIVTMIPFGGAFAQSRDGKKTEFVSTEPYKEFEFFYNHYKHLNISLNGTVKSVVQTEVPVSLLKKNHSSEKVYVRQQTWEFSPTGHLNLCHINKTFMKDVLDYDFNDERALFGDKYVSTDTLAYYSFNSIGQIRRLSLSAQTRTATAAGGSTLRDSCPDSLDDTPPPYRSSPRGVSLRPRAADSSFVLPETPFR